MRKNCAKAVNILLAACVPEHYLCATGRVGRTIIGYNRPLIPLCMHPKTTSYPTSKNSFFHLLSGQLSPLSTWPITMTTTYINK